MEIFYGIVTFLVGIGVMLFGVKAIGEALEKTTGTKFRNLISRATKKPIGATGVGLGFTLMLQSSSASMGMFVALCNAGVITLIQATGIVFGVNIGAALIHSLVTLGSIKVVKILSLTVVAGSFILLFSRSPQRKNIGKLLVAIGLLLLGISLISDGMAVINDLGFLDAFISSISNPVLMMLLFIAITCMLQTSMGTFAVLVSFLTTGLVSVELALWAVIGFNIGSSLNALLFVIGTSQNAKRVGLMHVLFNFFGLILFSILLAVLPIANWLQAIFVSPVFTALSFDILFNIIIAALFMPFTKQLARITTVIFKDKETVKRTLPRIDESIPTAAIVPAVLTCVTQVYSQLVSDFFLSIDYLFDKKETDRAKLTRDCIDVGEAVNDMEKSIIKLSASVSAGDQDKLSKFLDIVHRNRTIIRKIQKILFFASRWDSKKFSVSQSECIKEICDSIYIISVASLTALDMFDSTEVFDRSELVVRVLELDNKVDTIKNNIRTKTIQNIKDEKKAENFATFSNIINAIEDISETFATIALTVS